MDGRETELDAATWARVFSEAADLGVLQVHLSGGEPASRRDLPDIMAAARGAERLRTARENLDGLLALPEGDGDGAASPELDRALADLATLLGTGADATRVRFEGSMDDDFGTPGALAALFDLASALNRLVDAASKRRAGLGGDRREVAARGAALLRELGGVLGLRLVAVVTQAQADGVFKADIEPRFAAMAFYGAIEQLLTGWIFDLLPQGEEHFERAKWLVVETICGGLETSAARQPSVG